MNSPLQLGDLVVLTREGCKQPAPELKAIWTVERLTQTHALVRFDRNNQMSKESGQSVRNEVYGALGDLIEKLEWHTRWRQ